MSPCLLFSWLQFRAVVGKLLVASSPSSPSHGEPAAVQQVLSAAKTYFQKHLKTGATVLACGKIPLYLLMIKKNKQENIFFFLKVAAGK